MSSDAQRQRPRQDPVSCDSCRKKKLKCDRDLPCANCTSRGVLCVYQGRRPPAATIASDSEEVSALRRENAAIRARIDRLEDLVYSGSIDVEARPSKVRRIVHDETVHALISPATTLTGSPQCEVTKNYCRDVRWLEGVGTQENTRLPQLSAPYSIRVVPLQHIIEKSTFEDRHERCIYLPDEEVGLQFYDTYAMQLDPLQHLIHGPTTRQAVQQLYRKLHAGENVDPNDTVLFLATISSVSSYWGLSENVSFFFSSTRTAINVAVFWLRTALDVLEHVRRTTSATLETVQACIIIMFLIYHVEGFSPKVRAIVYTTLATAKDLGMHRTDDPGFLPAEESQEDVVDREVRRRVWWHLASTDWSLALAGGPHEGTYTVNPKHMKVRRPRNISDHDLATKSADFSRPLSEPTVMAYYLQRIRLAEICRHIADIIWETKADQVTAEDIDAIDREFDAVVTQLPDFLRLEKGHPQKFRYLDDTNPEILTQRYVINLTIQAKRCKFHLPFLLLAANDDKYFSSRDACLRAARAVLQLQKTLAEEDGTLWINSSRLCGIIQLFFYATMVLVMDFCVHRNAGCEVTRKQEIQDACRKLEEAKEECRAAGMFLDSLTAILRKHRVRLQNAEQVQDDLNSAGNPKAAEANALAVPGWNNALQETLTTHTQVDGFANLDFDDLWQSYIDLDASIDPQSWAALVSEIDSLYQGAEH